MNERFGEEQLRQYLLDRLPEAEGHRIEELAFEDTSSNSGCLTPSTIF
jgi:hypothetical protein